MSGKNIATPLPLVRVRVWLRLAIKLGLGAITQYIVFCVSLTVICSLDALKKSSKKKETRIKRETIVRKEVPAPHLFKAPIP